ncbi:phage portal protein [Tundrisphaera sp. TA3]|uniref:phage portal protein n=1 Tax=Tundrisphaera sp. TA3 TaxID=3435775 RepID=UPI003EBBE121
MAWPFRTKTQNPPEEKALSMGGWYFGSRLLTPAAASYGRLAKEGYGENSVAFACANKIASSAASVELHLFRKKNGKTERVEESELLTLLDRPNPLQSGREFLGHLASYFALSGNAYIHGAAGLKSRPKSLYLLSPGHVEVEAGPYMGIPKEYVYKPNANTRLVYPVDQLTARSEILQVKTFNPLSPWYGMAPMDAAALSIDLHNAGNVWNYSLLKQGARPSGALLMKGGDGKPVSLTEEQFARTKRQVDEQFSGSGNAGRPLLLEGGMEWQEMSMSPKDVDFLEGKHSAAREIALAFGVPPMLLGIPGDATYSNMAEARLALYTDTVLPLLQLIIGGLNRWLTPLYGEGLYLWYDEEMIPALEPLRKDKSERINAATYLTIDEKRAAMGYDDYVPTGSPGGTILVPTKTVPLERAGKEKPKEPDEPPEDAD